MKFFKALIFTFLFPAFAFAQNKKPNIIIVLADDLGYGDLACFGSKIIKTPNLDALAQDGLKLTNCYSGNTVCAPSRYSLMTGKHMGNAYIRGNGEIPLRKQDKILPMYLKEAGYQTGLFGKWGLGDINTDGIPSAKGWDHFIGYLHHVEAHYQVPSVVWASLPTQKIPKRKHIEFQGYANDVFMAEGKNFIEKRDKNKPFFMMLSVSMPHADLRVPESTLKLYQDANGKSIFDEKPFAGFHYGGNLMPRATYAAMVTHLDGYMGQLRKLLEQQGLDQNTIIIFSSDNGTHSEGGRTKEDHVFMNSSGGFRGAKRDLYDGGIRVPTIIWGNGLAKNQERKQAVAFWDLMPTIFDYAQIKQKPTDKMDGISLKNMLQNDANLPSRPLYWEFYELGFKQAILKDDFKYIKITKDDAVVEELYDLKSDKAEKNNIITQKPEITIQMQKLLTLLRAEPEHPDFKITTKAKAH